MSSSNQARTDNRKQAVSIRLSRRDVRNIKHLAERLGARDSDVIRFAIKLMLARLTLLEDPNVRGRRLVPVFMESGEELVRHFELDATKLSGIINDGVEDEQRVESDDIQLIAMNAMQRSHPQLRVPGLRHGKGFAGGTDTGEPANGIGHGESLQSSLRKYLYDKYLYTGIATSSHGTGG